ncbi:hypothetical protein JCM8208_005484 [Rhodotorula glutinis]
MLAPSKRLNKLLSHLVTLYGAPIDEREYGVYDAAKAQFAEQLETVNAARVVGLQQVKAAFSLLHDNAALVPGFVNAAHGVALEVYLSHLDPGQQDAVVARVRDFIFAACEERAVHGEALDPDEHLVDLLGALHARDLGHALCAARLNSVVYFVESHSAPSPVVEHFQGVVDQFCGDVWTHRFSALALSQQLYAVGMVRALLGKIQTLTAREILNQLADILPMSSSSRTSWKHPPQVDGPPVALRSLAHRSPTHRAPLDANSTASSTSSRYFPQARSARW